MNWQTINMIKNTILDNEGDFFTSGLKNAENSLFETKRDFTKITMFLSIICIITFAIRAFMF